MPSHSMGTPLPFPNNPPQFRGVVDLESERPGILSTTDEGDDDTNPHDLLLYLSPPNLSSNLAFLPLADDLNGISRKYLSECRYHAIFNISTNLILY